MGAAASGLILCLLGAVLMRRDLRGLIRRRTWRRATASIRFEPGPAGCDDLHAAVALAVALACKAPRVDSPAQDVPAAERTRTEIVLAALGGAGALPGLQSGGVLALSWNVTAPWRIRLAALAMRALSRDLSQAGAYDAGSAAGRLQLCAAVTNTALVTLSVCAGPEAGAVWAHGSGYAPSRRAVGARLGLNVDLEARLGLSDHWALHTGLGASLPLVRPRFAALDARGALVASEPLPPLAAAITLGLGYTY